MQDSERAVSYGELLREALAGAGELAERGVAAGDHVAVALAGGVPFAVAMHACWLAGAIVVPVDVRLSGAEREVIAQGCALVVDLPLVADGVSPTSRPGTPDNRSSASIPDWRSTYAAYAAGKASDPGASIPGHALDAVATVIHTSGTTSRPKRVELTFGNLLWSALGSGVALGSNPRERWLCTLPVCHVGGLSILVRSAINAATAVVHERFETERALGALMHEGITLVSVVATTLARLLDSGLEHPPTLRCALAGGGPVPVSLLARAAQAGVPVCQTYGLTEACSQVSTVPLAVLAGRDGLDAGDPLDSHVVAEGPGDVRPLDSHTGADGLGAGRPLFCTRVEISAEGEILVHGPTVAPAALADDGWLHTGDLGRLDEHGNLHLIGRRAETIISGGENVAPAEVEAVLQAHPQVAEAAVIARGDPRWGEAVTAVVVPREGVRPAADSLRAHCARQLAPYKVPKQFVFRDDPLPRTGSGKLLRRQLK